MQRKKLNQALIKMFALITLCLTIFSFTTKFGLDSYEIFLNNKLILKQSVNQPLNLRILKLDKADQDDQLRINYKHCTTKGGVGTKRNIIVKDEKGNILKKWEFADATDTNLSMVISVKELLQLEKNNFHNLSLHYTSQELPKGEMLAAFQLK